MGHWRVEERSRGSAHDEAGCVSVYNAAMSREIGEGFEPLSSADWEQTFDEALWSSLSLVRGAERQVVGFALACGYSEGSAVVQMMSVEAAFQGQGMGRGLLGSALGSALANGALQAMACVRTISPRSQEFYRRVGGFIDVARPDVDYQGHPVYPVLWRLSARPLRLRA